MLSALRTVTWRGKERNLLNQPHSLTQHLDCPEAARNKAFDNPAILKLQSQDQAQSPNKQAATQGVFIAMQKTAAVGIEYLL
jgi:hypothetical protein